ncbi:YciI family protein [Larsenimonas salina]|uniref:YciI family protein n=1 Tax=Larsenimonas salina TaxID=1295565 RepID=UPI0020741269|nr:YciI family protein [Larsenimonas salina]MCM5705403.1 YciI family protein [Larsenimonas salina]
MTLFLVLLSRDQEVSHELITAHRDYLHTLKAQDRLMLAGPFKDIKGGAYVLKADTLADARALAEQDPLIDSGIATFVVHEWAAH